MDLLAAMEVYVAIAEQGSLSGAAASLDKAPPTVVRSLALLEQHLGRRLVSRTTRRMSLTEEGEVYLDHCRQILASVTEAAQAITADDAELKGLIRVTAPVLFGQRHLMPLLLPFAKRHRAVTFELLFLDRVVGLVEEGLDLGIRIGHLPDSSMIGVAVGQMRRVVAASPECLVEHGEPKAPSALGELPCVLVRGLTRGSAWAFQHQGRAKQIPVHPAMICNQVASGIDACVAGLGFGSFLHYQVAPLVAEGKLRLLLEDHEVPALPVSVVYPGARLMSPRLRALVDWLRDGLRKELAPQES